MPPLSIFWFRRDLRLHDNTALFQALSSGKPVLPIFIFDQHILDQLEDKEDKRVQFIYEALVALQKDLKKYKSSILILQGYPEKIFADLIQEYKVHSVFANHDYEPYAINRDRQIKKILEKAGIEFLTYKDQVIFEQDEIVKDDGGMYTVYTPYSKKWLKAFSANSTNAFKSESKLDALFTHKSQMPALKNIGFVPTQYSFLQPRIDKQLMHHYHQTRDYPAIEGTTQLGIHLRFGTVSIRELVKKASELNEVFLKELIWREFFMQLLWHRPELVNKSCKPDYENIKWRNNEKEFDLWCKGETGYPIVDAGMRQLNETGFMHNRVRMITASFLVKHLLIDWRWGEAYFAKKLLDYELASNNGNWQWVAGCGCDAAPYFRIFNPAAQTKRFDKQEKYIQQWVPEYGLKTYSRPIVDHEFARQRCLDAYKKALRTNKQLSLYE